MDSPNIAQRYKVSMNNKFNNQQPITLSSIPDINKTSSAEKLVSNQQLIDEFNDYPRLNQYPIINTTHMMNSTPLCNSEKKNVDKSSEPFLPSHFKRHDPSHTIGSHTMGSNTMGSHTVGSHTMGS